MARPPAGLFFVPGAARAAGCRYHDGMEAALQSLAAKITQAAARGRPLRIRGGGTKDFYGQQLHGELLDARPLAGVWSVGRHTSPPASGISTTSSTSVSSGLMPCTNAAP